MTIHGIVEWSDERIARTFCEEIRQHFEANNAAHRAVEAAALEAILREHPEKAGLPGFEVQDSGPWRVYLESEIRIDSNRVRIILPRDTRVGVDLIGMFDNTSVAWSYPSVGAISVDGEARPIIEVLLVPTWNDALDAERRNARRDGRRLRVELFEEEVRALIDASDRPHHAACNCADYAAEERPCVFCAGMPPAVEAARKARRRLRLALEPLA